MSMTVSSSAFGPNDTIPRQHTCDGDDVPPPLRWSGAPSSTRAFALVMDDPDAPSGTFTHWMLADLPADLTHLDPDALAGIVAGRNDFGSRGYRGPCPPSGPPHRYRFHLHALREPLRLHAGFSRSQIDAALTGRVIASASLEARFGRSRP